MNQDSGDASAVSNTFGNLIVNLRTGLKLIVYVPVSVELFRPGLRFVCIGIVLSSLIIAGFDYAQQAGEIYFSDQGAGVLGTFFFLVVLIAIIVSRIQNDMQRLPLLLTIIFSISPRYLLFVYAFRDYSGELAEVTALWIIALFWGLAVLLRAVKVTFRTINSQALFWIILFAIVSTMTARERHFYPRVFYSYEKEKYAEYEQIDEEKTYYRQAELLAQKLRALAPATPGQPDLYFVGFAGNGDQTVFRTEVKFVKALMDRNFGTGERSIKLVNDLKKLETEPLANSYNLKAVLNQMGQIMNVEDDILFLYLTSHGARDAKLQVSLYPFDLNSLSAPNLAEFLAGAEIQWRIIIISACFSGSFIETLATEKTLILTSAAPDRTSFGCSNDRELTYFGEAMFADELANGGDLIDAFHAAKDSIRTRELEEGLQPSNPQIYVGSEMKEKLKGVWPNSNRTANPSGN